MGVFTNAFNMRKSRRAHAPFARSHGLPYVIDAQESTTHVEFRAHHSLSGPRKFIAFEQLFATLRRPIFVGRDTATSPRDTAIRSAFDGRCRRREAARRSPKQACSKHQRTVKWLPAEQFASHCYAAQPRFCRSGDSEMIQLEASRWTSPPAR